ncbi:hypothetical protein CEUSTIGMA_g2117.t1 [Chlamydomonas eustigma]|uniref:Glutaredoxin domain-containing protein n=1 Tax=Chlamydomonas eustigma TaxID=1157962 RepID=A0A250WVD5_9CHLO|nr:hypothetical protein CEUSTIGMA_g2117.t1 [Chlamydomonas eustigma]|eukprot:GAX74669.1 hypothetical protein CEUSTIGMA_g2117.t1 [Chlamydomonas eustigma]
MAFLAQRPVASMMRNASYLRPSAERRSSVQIRASAQTFVEDNIKNNKVVVFSKSHCPYCSKAKAALGGIIPKEKFAVFEIENNPECSAIQDVLMGMTGARSVPRVFIDGKFIGGGDDTARMAQNGELKKLLTEAGVL